MALIPREEKYFALLNELIANVEKGSQLLVGLFENFLDHPSYAAQIKQVERDCDRISGQIVDQLNSTFITPMDREDLYLLATELDDIMDTINEMGRLTVIYNIQNTSKPAQELARILNQSVVELKAAVGLIEHRDGITNHIRAVKALEEQGDRASQAAIQNLFTNEPNPIEVIRWLKIYEDMEAGIDMCWNVARVVEAVMMKNA